MSNKLSPELQAQIEQEAEHYANVQHTEKAKHIDHPQSHRWDDAKEDWEAGATTYASLWQEAEQRAERYEKALKQIEQMSDPGDYWLAVCRMKSIASDALTPKTSTDAAE